MISSVEVPPATIAVGEKFISTLIAGSVESVADTGSAFVRPSRVLRELAGMVLVRLSDCTEVTSAVNWQEAPAASETPLMATEVPRATAVIVAPVQVVVILGVV